LLVVTVLCAAFSVGIFKVVGAVTFVLENHCPITLIGLIPSLAVHPWGYSYERLNELDLSGQMAIVTGAN
jgi:hypothetical protein